MTGCCVPLCTGSSAKGQRVFRFPRDVERRKKWAAQVKRDNWAPTDTTKICELHFEQDQFELNRQDGRRLLKWNALPTLFDYRLSSHIGTSSTATVPQHLPQSSSSKDGYDVATQESPEVRHRCPHCNIACPEESTLAIHVRCHEGAGDKPHCCHLCPATYADKHSLKTHLQRHWGIKRWKCSDCSYNSFSKYDLVMHIRYRHSGERPFKCDLCDKAFASRAKVMIHRRIHTNERPYACRLCPATFGDRSAMRNHFLRMHSTARPHTCEHCGKSFVTSGDLNRHVQMHTGDKPHLCHLCPARFTRHDRLVFHVRTHTGDRPYRCKQCEKCFFAATSLTKHVKSMHSSKPAYPCKLCPKKYKHSGSLRAHVKAHHPAEGTM